MHLQFEQNVKIPGPFVVMQGIDGDGIINTVDSSPFFACAAAADDATNPPPPVAQQAIKEWMDLRRISQTSEAVDWIQHAKQQAEALNNKTTSPTGPIVPILTTCDYMWWLSNAELRVFSELPTPIPTTDRPHNRTLAPGTTLRGTGLVTFEKRSNGSWSSGSFIGGLTLNHLPSSHAPKAGKIQYLEFQDDQSSSTSQRSYVAFSVDGYPLLAPGTVESALFTGKNRDNNSIQFWWKVVCASGAVVRRDKGLQSTHLHTIPYGTHVLVLRKIVNSSGLSRLYVQAAVEKKNDENPIIEGWCSEFLNPLSGQRGPILKPIPPAVPVLYQVVLAEQGATLRQQCELASPIIKTLPHGTRVPVLSRVFTEFPVTDCIPRLQVLAPMRAFASLRLNNDNRSTVLTPTGKVDETFDPQRAGLYFWASHLKYEREREANPPQADSPTRTTSKTTNATTIDAFRTSTTTGDESSNPTCVVCLQSEANATLVHGETGHICCCLDCARICKAQGVGCPLCRKDIERVILHYYS